MDKKVEIVSLGVNCLPRTILTRGGVKPRKADGELSCPFDLALHKLPNIIHYLETNFEDYFSDLYFEIRKRNFLDFRKNGLWKKQDGTVFYHDKDCKAQDRDKISIRIRNRINNLYEIIYSSKPIIFVLNIVDDEKEVEKLNEILKKLCKHKKYKLAILDFYNIVNYFDKDIEILKIPLPTNDFTQNWNMQKYRNTQLGVYVISSDTC